MVAIDLTEKDEPGSVVALALAHPARPRAKPTQ
jgi:hypothetical protein